MFSERLHKRASLDFARDEVNAVRCIVIHATRYLSSSRAKSRDS